MSLKTRVVHCKKEKYDVYIGRGKCPETGKFSVWGNPFRIGPNMTREEAIEAYRVWLLSRSPKAVRLRARLPELNGKVLGCWCSPRPCHGDVLAELADSAVGHQIDGAK